MKINRILAAAVLAAAFSVAGATAASADTPQKCPDGSHGVVIGVPDPTKPYYICFSEPGV